MCYRYSTAGRLLAGVAASNRRYATCVNSSTRGRRVVEVGVTILDRLGRICALWWNDLAHELLYLSYYPTHSPQRNGLGNRRD